MCSGWYISYGLNPHVAQKGIQILVSTMGGGLVERAIGLHIAYRRSMTDKNFPINAKPMTRSKLKTIRTPAILKKASSHVAYEVWMLNEVGYIIAANKPQGVWHNALLESFIVHARSLDAFLFRGDDGWDDDITAEDYFECRSSWKRQRGKREPVLYRYQLSKPAAKHALHLSYKRTITRKQWSVMPIALALNTTFIRFLRTADRDRIDAGVYRFADHFNNLLWSYAKNRAGNISSTGVR